MLGDKTHPQQANIQSQSISNETEHDPAYKKLLESFKVLAQVSDPIRQEFELVTAARSHKLPISSYRKMFRAWLTSQQGKGVEL